MTFCIFAAIIFSAILIAINIFAAWLFDFFFLDVDVAKHLLSGPY